MDIPIIVDADTGYGNPLNVHRTVKDLIDAGETLCETEYPALRRIFAPLPEPMEVNAWARRLTNCVQQRDPVGAIDIVRETLPSYSPSDTLLSLSMPDAKKAQL